MQDINVGDMVKHFVFVGTDKIAMGTGKVTEVCSGYCMVDHCYPYGKPWIYAERWVEKIPELPR